MSIAPPKGLTIERVREFLSYDPETGVFRWRVARGGMRAGDVAGSTIGAGYVYISIDDHPYLAHQLAWLLMTGEWPQTTVDHRDRDKTNNRWSNLRPATKGQQLMNRTAPKNNTSGVRGVTWDAARQRWKAFISVNHRQIDLGRHRDKEAAIAARAAAEREHFGEFGVLS